MSSASSSSSPSPNYEWASLPTDILEVLVGLLLSAVDRQRFGAVCKSWREVAVAVKQNTTRTRRGVAPLPLMTSIEPVDGVKGGKGEAPVGVDRVAAATPVTRRFYSLSEDRVYSLQVPSESRWWRCFGSSRGWLGMIDLCLNTFLFDPISGGRVDLPSLTTLTRLILGVKKKKGKKDGATLFIYREPNNKRKGHPHTATYLRDKFIQRLALSSSPLDPDCIVMATVTGYRLLAYTRPGADSWAELHLPGPPENSWHSWHFRDIIHGHDRRFYAISGDRLTISIDFESSKSPAHIPDHQNSDLVRPEVETIVPWTDCGVWEDGMYLVALPSGEIAQVVRYFRDDPGRPISPYETDMFIVHKLSRSSGGGVGEWEDADYIGDCCLFVGFNESMSLPPFEVLGKHRTNCIFFTDDISNSYYGKDYGGLDFGIYDYEEERVDHFCHNIDARRMMPPPMWITPNL